MYAFRGRDITGKANREETYRPILEEDIQLPNPRGNHIDRLIRRYSRSLDMQDSQNIMELAKNEDGPSHRACLFSFKVIKEPEITIG